MKLEQALTLLRRGNAIRRTSWEHGIKLVKVGDDVFIVFGQMAVTGSTEALGHTPRDWQPYPADLLADNWEKNSKLSLNKQLRKSISEARARRKRASTR